MPPRSLKRKAVASAEPSRKKRHARKANRPSPKALATFSSLPEELLLEILDHLGAQHDKTQIRTLYSLCLTSRQLYRLTKLYLYSSVDNGLIDPGKLIRTVLQQPGLAERAKFLHWVDNHSDPTTKSLKLSQIERRELCKRMDRLGLPNAKLYSRAFGQQASQDHLAAVLMLSPNLECLDVTDTNVCCFPRGYHNMPPWIRFLDEVGFGSTPRLSDHFKHLNTIRFRMGPITLDSIAPIMRIPSLRTLMLEDIFQVGQIAPCLWGAGVSPHSSRIQFLYIENSYIDSRAVAQILNAIRGLRLFCFEFDNWVRSGAYRFYEDQPPELHYPTLAKALLGHKDTIEQLSLEDSSDWELREFYQIDTETLGSLRELHKLVYLDIGFDPFKEDLYLGDDAEPRPADLADNLPSGLEQMDLTIEEELDSADEDFWKKSLEDLANSCRPKLPYLKEVRVAKRLAHVIPLDDEIKKIKEIFAKKGVSLTMCGEPAFSAHLDVAQDEYCMC